MGTDRPVVPVSARARWLTVGLLAGAILVVSVIPVPESVPEEGGGIPASLAFHFLGYGALAAALAMALLSRRLRVAIGGAFVGASAYGALIELIQLGLPYRTFSYLDVVINAMGAAAALLVVSLLVLVRRSE